MSRFLVTGAAGFIGSNLVERLLKDGHDVVGVDNLSTGTRDNLENLGDCKLIVGDLCEKEVCKEAIKGVDYVLHEAASASVPRSVEDPEAFVYNNVVSTMNILLAARDAGVQRLVYASSASVYGNAEGKILQEDMITDPYNPYAVSKLAAEWVVRVFWRTYGLPTVCLRYFNVFGPRQCPEGSYAAVVPAFIRAALRHEQATIHDDGSQARDFTYVGNVVQANLLACDAPEVANGDAFNVAVGGFTTINEIQAMIAEAADDDTLPVHTERRAGDVRGCRSNISKIIEVLGYKPTMGVAEGIKRTVRWYEENLKG